MFQKLNEVAVLSMLDEVAVLSMLDVLGTSIQ